MTEDEFSEYDAMWSHEIRHCGPYSIGVITCLERQIGWHLQDHRSSEIFFITGPDITGSEIERYRDSLINNEFSVEVVVGREHFMKFIEDNKDSLDPLLVMAASYVHRD